MTHIENLSDNAIVAMIIFVILVLIKGFFSVIKLISLDKILFKNYTSYLYYKEIVDSIIDSVLFLFACVILFFRKNNSILTIILAILFLLKGFFQYFIDLDLYTYTNISNTTVDKMRELKHPVSFITNIVLFIASIYILKIIFIK
jgi:hypothetical protein